MPRARAHKNGRNGKSGHADVAALIPPNHPLTDETIYFARHQAALRKKYPAEFIAIKNGAVVAHHLDQRTAFDAAVAAVPEEPFLFTHVEREPVPTNQA